MLSRFKKLFVATSAAVVVGAKKNVRTSLSMKEFDSILSSEVKNELGSNTMFWEEVTNFEWEKARETEGENAQNDQKLQLNSFYADLNSVKVPSNYPFIICNSKKKSGFERISYIKSLLAEEVHIITISNTENQTCGIVQITASMAEHAASSSSHIVVHPLGSILKLREGLIHAIQDESARVLDINLIPGASDLESVWDDIIESIQNGSNKNGRSLPESFFWTGLKRGRNLRVLQSHDRALMWSRAIKKVTRPERLCTKMLDKLIVTLSDTKDFIKVEISDGETTSLVECVLSLAAAISSHPQVYSVDSSPEIEPLNVEAQWVVQSGVPDKRPWFDAGLTGAGQIVAVSDTGIDTNNCYFWDASKDEKFDGSINLEKRKVVQYVGYADQYDGNYGHGTHVAGTIVGRKSIDGTKKSESTGFADGIARDAKVSFFDFFYSSRRGGNQFCCLPNKWNTFLDYGKKAGAKIHNISWGSNVNRYINYDKMLDEYMYENEDFLIVVAAGNTGPREHTVGSPGIAKNVLTVGASQSSRQNDGEDYLAYFSASGPTDDGRTKPDVVAPGYSILSAGAVWSERGECDPPFLPTYGKHEGIAYLAGTSMAAPVVSGTAALIRQYFEEGWYPSGSKAKTDGFSPSGTLVKAVLMNGAQSLLGLQHMGIQPVEYYDNRQNFGRISLIDSLPLKGTNAISAQVFDRQTISVNQIHEKRIMIKNCDTKALSVTLVWTEKPAEAGCKNCLYNDLDLFLRKGINGEKIYPNNGKDKDKKNNAERVRVDAAEGDIFTVSVHAANLMTQSQKYAMVVTGCLST